MFQYFDSDYVVNFYRPIKVIDSVRILLFYYFYTALLLYLIDFYAFDAKDHV